MCTLSVAVTHTGQFTGGDAHTWVTGLLPDIPPTLPPGQDGASYVFQNTLLGTQLLCRCVWYKRGHRVGRVVCVCDCV